MFLVSNSKNTNHEQQYVADPGQSTALFDLSEKQLTYKKNNDWHKIKPGSLVCSIGKIKGRRPLLRIHLAQEIQEIKNDSAEKTSILRGDLIAHCIGDREYSNVLQEFRVTHSYISPKFHFMTGVNVIDLGDQLNNLRVEISDAFMELKGISSKTLTLGKLESILQNTFSEDHLSKIFPDEIPLDHEYFEGSAKQVYVNAYERNPEARRKCLSHYGFSCVICTTNLEEIYGAAAEGLIHVHHLRPLSEIKAEYKIDPIKDLSPVCPNCHAVLHRRIPAFTIEEVRAMFESRHD